MKSRSGLVSAILIMGAFLGLECQGKHLENGLSMAIDPCDYRMTWINGSALYTCYALYSDTDIQSSRWLTGNEVLEPSDHMIIDFAITPIGNFSHLLIQDAPLSMNGTQFKCEGTFSSNQSLMTKSVPIYLQPFLTAVGNPQIFSNLKSFFSKIQSGNPLLPTPDDEHSQLSFTCLDRRVIFSPQYQEQEPGNAPEGVSFPIKVKLTWESPFHFDNPSICPNVAYLIEVIDRSEEDFDLSSGSGSGRVQGNNEATNFPDGHGFYEIKGSMKVKAGGSNRKYYCHYPAATPPEAASIIDSAWTTDHGIDYEAVLPLEKMLCGDLSFRITPIERVYGEGESTELPFHMILGVKQIDSNYFINQDAQGLPESLNYKALDLDLDHTALAARNHQSSFSSDISPENLEVFINRLRSAASEGETTTVALIGTTTSFNPEAIIPLQPRRVSYGSGSCSTSLPTPPPGRPMPPLTALTLEVDIEHSTSSTHNQNKAPQNKGSRLSPQQLMPLIIPILSSITRLHQ